MGKMVIRDLSPLTDRDSILYKFCFFFYMVSRSGILSFMSKHYYYYKPFVMSDGLMMMIFDSETKIYRGPYYMLDATIKKEKKGKKCDFSKV